MSEKKNLVQSIVLKEKKTLEELINYLRLDTRFHAVIVNGKRINKLDEVIDEESKIIILPKIRGGTH